MYQAYVFDFDLTLVDSREGIAMCFEMLLKDEGYPAVPRPDICRTIGLPMMQAMSVVTGETDKGLLAKLCRYYKVRYSDTYMTPNTHLFPETIPALQRIKTAGATTIIVSSKTRSRINETITRDHLENLIDCVIGTEDVDAPKPDPQGLLLVMDRFDLRPKDILYIGDSTIDAETAKNANVDFAAVTTGMTEKKEFKKWPCVRVMGTLEELGIRSQESAVGTR